MILALDTEFSGSKPILIEVRFPVGARYGNVFDQRFAMQQLCKHGPTHNNRGGYAFRVRGDVMQLWVVVT
jgi:hypothetical protein